MSILTLVILFAAAASCNLCGLNLSSADTTSTDVDAETDSISTEAAETGDAIAEATDKETVKETSEEETTGIKESTTEDSNAAAPTIKLKIYEGPTYSAADDICYYRVQAIVTGSPAPVISFSKDNSNGSFGKDKAQVNLTKSSPSYTLTAKAKNSAGEATGSMTLDWGCTETTQTTEEESKELTADVKLIAVYADSKPNGNIFVIIMNNGPDELVNQQVVLNVSETVTTIADPQLSMGSTGFKSLWISIKPEETVELPIGIKVDLANYKYRYVITMEAVGFVDSYLKNNKVDKLIEP